MAKGLTLKVGTKLPWWWRPVFVLAWFRLLPGQWTAELIARHTTVIVADEDGRELRK